MLSRSSLKAELVVFRDNLKPPREEFGPWLVRADRGVKAPDQKGRLVGNRNSADLQLLDRWINRCDRKNLDDAEKLWMALQGEMAAPELIRLVLQARRKAQATVNQIYGAKWKGPSSDEVRRIREKRRAEGRGGLVQIAKDGEIIGLNKEWRELKLKEELTDNLSLANLKILERAYNLHSDYADLVSQFNKEPRQRDDGGTRIKRLFWDLVGNYLQIRFGKWFDADVAVLTEIAFNLPATSVTPEHIADARKHRHGTRTSF